MKKIVYLCGPISGCSDDEARNWRERAQTALRPETKAGLVSFLDPMRRDYRGREDECVTEIVEGDLADIRRADILLVAHPRPSTGTDMEIRCAKAELGKVVIVWSTEEHPSPWLRYHADVIVDSLGSALVEVRARLKFGHAEAQP